MRLLCTLTALTLACASAGAQTYPTKSIRWVVPSTPGDGSDVTGRLIADKISRELGQAVVIDNKPGAGGVLGSDAVAKSAADGYTMIVGNAGSHGVNAGIYSKLPYDVVKDFVPVAMICTTPNVMVVSPNTKAKTVAEFIALAKANPGKFNYASGGVGSSAHLSAELFKSMTSTDITHIPYKGSSPAVAALLADESQLMIGNLPPWSAQIKAGKIQALAVTTAAPRITLELQVCSIFALEAPSNGGISVCSLPAPAHQFNVLGSLLATTPLAAVPRRRDNHPDKPELGKTRRSTKMRGKHVPDA